MRDGTAISNLAFQSQRHRLSSTTTASATVSGFSGGTTRARPLAAKRPCLSFLASTRALPLAGARSHHSAQERTLAEDALPRACEKFRLRWTRVPVYYSTRTARPPVVYFRVPGTVCNRGHTTEKKMKTFVNTVYYVRYRIPKLKKFMKAPGHPSSAATAPQTTSPLLLAQMFLLSDGTSHPRWFPRRHGHD